jgi:hypothetical protein
MCDKRARVQTRYLSAGGGTSVSAGLSMALRVLRERRQCNPVSAVLLLSDGQDAGGAEVCGPVAAALGTAGATVHTWGFGDDHDPLLMSALAGACPRFPSLPLTAPARLPAGLLS